MSYLCARVAVLLAVSSLFASAASGALVPRQVFVEKFGYPL